MVNLDSGGTRLCKYWIDKAPSAARICVQIVFAVILFLVARKLILWLCGLIRKNMRRFHTEEAVVSFHRFHGEIQSEHAAGADHYRSARYRIRSVDRSSYRLRQRCCIPWHCRAASQTLQAA